MNEPDGEFKGIGWRVSLSIIASVGWLVFLILWLFFFASNCHIYRNIAIIFASLLTLSIILGVPWAIWGFRHMSEEGKEIWNVKGFRWRVWLSIILVFTVFVFLIIWFYFYAFNWTVYQNIAVFIISILIIGGILGVAWAPWGMKNSKKWDKNNDFSPPKNQ